MPDNDATPADLPRLQAALGARAILKTWSEGAELIELLRTAHQAGWLARLREPVRAQELAALGDAPVERVANILDVLTSAGVTARTSDGYRLTDGFDAFVAGDTGVDLGESLDAVDLMRSRIAQPDEPVTGAQALVVARDWGIGPTEAARELYQALYAAIPEYRARLEQGGPLLDVGCGIGAAVLSTATMYPALRAVGVEMVPEVAAQTRRRAQQFGVADRVEIRTADARTLTDESAFEVSFWAQPFFQPDTRSATLAVILRALRPGGLLICQELFPPVSEEDESNVRARLDRLFIEELGGSFGRTAEELAAETKAAGFGDQEIVVTPLGRLVVSRTP